MKSVVWMRGKMAPFAIAVVLLPGCGGGGTSKHPSACGPPCGSISANGAIGCKEPTQTDLDWMEKWVVGPMHAVGDADGSECIDAADTAFARAAADGNSDLPCARAVDVDFTATITPGDVNFVASSEGSANLRLYQSAHMSCRAFSRVASRNLGFPGEKVPLLFLGELGASGQPPAIPRVVTGPATIEPFDTSGQHYVLHIAADAPAGARIETRVYVDVSPDAPEETLVYAKVFSIPLTVIDRSGAM